MSKNKKNIISIVYNSEDSEIDEKIKEINESIKENSKIINVSEKIKEFENYEQIKEIIKIIENNYNIKISLYNKEIYKKGFKDGVKLIIECLKK